jgi:hypothetical protein
LAPEELGAVYDGLLGLHPMLEMEPWRFGYLGETARVGARGSERKATGAYYTPPELVAELIKSALEPVMARAVAARKKNQRIKPRRRARRRVLTSGAFMGRQAPRTQVK